MHKLRFRTGEKVRVVKDNWQSTCSHATPIGTVLTIKRTTLESREGKYAEDYQEYLGDNNVWFAEDELELVQEEEIL